MSKRYVIQVLASAFGQAPEWLNYQHPAGGDWMTRSRSTAIADAAKLVQVGETRELRVMLSKPVFELVDAGVDHAAIVEASQTMYNDFVAEAIVDLEDENEDEDDEPQFELVTDPTDPDAPKLI